MVIRCWLHLSPRYYFIVTDKDSSQKALEQVDTATHSDRAEGEHLLDSPDLKRKLDDAKKALRPELPEGDPSDAPKP